MIDVRPECRLVMEKCQGNLADQVHQVKEGTGAEDERSEDERSKDEKSEDEEAEDEGPAELSPEDAAAVRDFMAAQEAREKRMLRIMIGTSALNMASTYGLAPGLLMSLESGCVGPPRPLDLYSAL